MLNDDRRTMARGIFNAAVESVQPERLINKAVALQGNELRIHGDLHPLEPTQKIHVFGSGKASVGMARSLLSLLGQRIAGGVIVTNEKPGEDLAPLRVVQGSHPVPDEKSVIGAESLIDGMSRLNENDFFIYLLSGGSSALIEKPADTITLAEMQETTKLLLHTNVTIQQVNAVRKHLSLVKGGRLGQCTNASGAVLVISDVIGDDLSVIGSGPLYCDPTTFAECREILERKNIWEKIRANVRTVIENGLQGKIAETPKQQEKDLPHYLLGTNRVALRQAAAKARELGLNCYILTSSLAGEAREVAKVLVSLADNISHYHDPFPIPACLLFGGETTVTVRGTGRGGRNQELALAALAEISTRDSILLLSGGTDGIDGNSAAAGAIADSGFYREALRQDLAIAGYLQDNNATAFFDAVGGLVTTGPTGTNVMDITIIIIDKEEL